MNSRRAVGPFAHEPSGVWPKVSVVVPIYNEAKSIGPCVQSLQRQDYPSDRLEIVIADGLSTDGSLDALRDAALDAPHPEIKVVTNPRRITAAGLNVGIAASSGDVIVRLDAHAEAPADYVRLNVQVLYSSGAEYVGGSPINVGRNYWGKVIGLAMKSRFGIGTSHFRYASRPGDVDTVAFGAFRRETFLRFGPFDEDLIYSEDNEYTHRIRTGGGRVYFDPAIRSWYHPRESLRAFCRQYRHYGWGRMRHALRDGGGISVRHLVPMTLLATLAVLGVASVSWQSARWALAALVAVYVLCAVVASARLAKRSRWPYLPALPLVFMLLHVGYGIGQWQAILGRVLGLSRRAGAST